MIKFKLFNKKCVVRALLVAAVGSVFCTLAGLIVRSTLNQLYIVSDSPVLYYWFYLIGGVKITIAGIILFGIIAAFANWIFYPSYLEFTHTLVQSFRLDEEAVLPSLPKHFKELEQELHSIHKELQLWKYALKESEKRKDELVVYLAHDIRTPLTSVVGYLDLLNEVPNLPAEQHSQFTQTALRKAHRMQALVEELFEITQYNVSRIELCKERVSAAILLQQLVEELEPLLKKRKLEVAVDIRDNPMLFIDAAKIARALDNILNNAVRYSPERTTIHVSCQNSNGVVAIGVANQGAEIPQAELNRCFERFYRADSARQSTTGGSGLGLAIAKSIVEAHGGNITAKNESRVTTFTICLPLDN